MSRIPAEEHFPKFLDQGLPVHVTTEESLPLVGRVENINWKLHQEGLVIRVVKLSRDIFMILVIIASFIKFFLQCISFSF